MNQKLVDEFGKKLKAIGKNLTFEVLENAKADLDDDFVRITEKGTVLIKYGDETAFTLVIACGVPAIDIDKPIMIDKDNSALFGDLIKLCGEYLDAFFGGDEHDN